MSRLVSEVSGYSRTRTIWLHIPVIVNTQIGHRQRSEATLGWAVD